MNESVLTDKPRRAGKIAGASLGSTVSILAGYGLAAAGIDVPQEVLSAGVSMITAAAVFVGHWFD